MFFTFFKKNLKKTTHRRNVVKKIVFFNLKTLGYKHHKLNSNLITSTLYLFLLCNLIKNTTFILLFEDFERVLIK